MRRLHSPVLRTREPYHGGSKGDSPWLPEDISGRGCQVWRPPDRQGVEPLGNELLVNEFILVLNDGRNNGKNLKNA